LKESIDSPWAWSADADLCQEKSGASHFCLKYTTLEAQLCQIQYSGQMRWSRILFEANINKSLGAQANVPLGHPHRGEIKSFNPYTGYGFIISKVPDKKTSLPMDFFWR